MASHMAAKFNSQVASKSFVSHAEAIHQLETMRGKFPSLVLGISGTSGTFSIVLKTDDPTDVGDAASYRKAINNYNSTHISEALDLATFSDPVNGK